MQEFVHVMATVTNYKGDPADLMNDEHSGLINYLFGKDRKKTINHKRFLKLQQDLMNDVLWVEFTRYCKDGETISNVEFCNHLLLCANITSKKKRQMVGVILSIQIRTTRIHIPKYGCVLAKCIQILDALDMHRNYKPIKYKHRTKRKV